MTKQVKADLMLLLVVAAWGFSFLMTDVGLSALGVFTLIAYRLLLAFVIAAALSVRRMRGVSRATAGYGLVLGGVLAGIFICVTFGVKYTTLSNSGFLCGLTVIFVPMLSFFVHGRPPGRKMLLVALVCLIGIALLTLTDSFSINRENLPGDLLCILCSVVYASHLLITEKAVASQGVDAYQLGVLQLAVAGVVCLALALGLEDVALPATPKVWGAVLFLAVVCTGMAFIVQTVAQQYTSASHVGVINCLETVFAGIVAYAIGGDVLTLRSGVGAALIVLALFAMEIDFGKLLKRRKGLD